MKPPYATITATCNKHGEFAVKRKANPKAGQRHPNGTGELVKKYPTAAVVCPKCRNWAKIECIEETLS